MPQHLLPFTISVSEIIVPAGPAKKIMLVPWPTVASMESSAPPERSVSTVMPAIVEMVRGSWAKLRVRVQDLTASFGDAGRPRVEHKD